MYSFRGLGASSSVSDFIAEQAPSYGVPPSLAVAVAQKESGFNQSAVGSSGEIGVFQLMPGTAAQLGVNPSDLDQNVQGGLTYLQSLYSRFGNWTQALQAYNGGPGNVANGTVSPAAQSYAASVLASAGDVSGPSVSALPVVGEDAGSVSDVDMSVLPESLSTGAWLALAALGVGVVVLWATR